MQVDAPTCEKYRTIFPPLAEAVMDEPGAGMVMRRDGISGECVKLQGGLCSIHAQYGTDALGDACHFYPRITRAIGQTLHHTATLSCPEIARLALLESDEAAANSTEIWLERLPYSLKQYTPEGLTGEQAQAIHQQLLHAIAQSKDSAEQWIARLYSLAQSLEMIPPAQWGGAIAAYLPLLDARLPAAERAPEDPFNLLQTLCGLVVATHKAPSSRLKIIIERMEAQLACTLDWSAVGIQTSPQSMSASQHVQAVWTRYGEEYRAILRRWLITQLSMMCFPFAGLGTTLRDKIMLLALRFSISKLALQCAVSAENRALTTDEVIAVIQPLSRLLDHLGDATFALAICKDAGWNKENRLIGLL